MKPILFASNATTYTTNGIGRLDAISCVVTEERNGVYELEMEIAETANHASDIEMSSIIVAIPSQGANAQPFRVYKISKPINGKFSVYAQHISYQLSYIPAMPFEVTASSSACNQTLQALKTNAAESCPFTFWTDVPTVASFAMGVPMSIRQALGGVDGSVLDKFGGEFEWDNYTVKLHRYRGVQTPTVSLRYGKNIIDLTQEKYISNTVTGICPYWVDSEGNNLVTLTEKVVESQYAQNFPFNRTVSMDMSQDFDEQPTQQQLRNMATAYLNQSGVGIPTVSTKVSFVNLTDEEGAALQTVKLCDMVGVYFEKLGISTTAKVVKTEYDVLKERYISVQLGSLRSSLVTTIIDTNGAITELQSKMQTKFATLNKAVQKDIGDAVDELEDEIVSATAWLTGSHGYVMAVKNTDGTWKELLFMDTNDVSTAHNVLRINENGLGFSSSGVGGPYTQAWTLDGKLVVGGTNVPSFTVYASDPVAGQAEPSIIFRTSRSGTIWNSENSQLSESGVFTVYADAQQGQSRELIFKTSKNGMMWKSANSELSESGVFIVYDDLQPGQQTRDIVFKTSKSGMMWNSENSQLSESGVFTVYAAAQSGQSPVLIFKASKDGIMWNSANSEMTESGVFAVYDDLQPGQQTRDIIFKTSKAGTIWNSDNSQMDENGTITMSGANIRSSDSGARVVIDNTSSIKGMYGDTMHNLINMEQSISGLHQMTIDADTQLNIRTPNVYVTDQSAGTGQATVYETVIATDQYMTDNPEYYSITNMGKIEASPNESRVKELWVQHVDEEDATPDDVYCTLPVYITYDATPIKYIHGMLIGKGTTESVVL